MSFLDLVTRKGSTVLFHRDESVIPCPCRTPEGFKDPAWHLANPAAPMCNENAMIPSVVEFTIKGFVQPVSSNRANAIFADTATQLFGEVQTDDHIGIFPCSYGGTTLNFSNWGRAGEDFIRYDNRRYTVVGVNKIPSPHDGSPCHHIECGLRLIDGT